MKLLADKKIRLFRPAAILAIFSLAFLIFQFTVITPVKISNGIGLKFDWPDEGANYFWTKELLVHHRLALPEPLNLWAENQIHPRSFNTNALGAVVPGSFLGLIILFATLAKIFGSGAIIYFTPVLALGAVWAFYYLVKKVFASESVALFSALLLGVSAPWQYYSFESLLPNVPFVSLFLVSVALLAYAKKNQFWLWLLSGLSAGLALAIRPSEFIWLAVVYLFVAIAKRRELRLLNVTLFLGAAYLAILPSIFFQQWIFGSLLVTGYDKLPALAQHSNVFLRLLTQAFLPFGFYPRLALHNFWHYFILISPVTFLLALLGGFIFVKDWKKKEAAAKLYFGLTIFVLLWLFNYYGSWKFDDLVTLSLNHLGASYVRYWLIIFAAILPFTALTLVEGNRRLKTKYFGGAAIVILAIMSFYQLLISDPNNILAVRQKVSANRIEAGNLLKDIPADAIIITNRGDKIFFPERRVIETFGANDDWQNYVHFLMNVAPVYFQEKESLRLLGYNGRS